METNTRPIELYTTSRQAWDAMYEALAGAKTSVHWEVYTFVDDDVGMRFVELLIETARRGVSVKLIADAMGSFSLSKKSIERMEAAGVDVIIFSVRGARNLRAKWRSLWSRTHRKILVVDEQVGFIGGVNIQKEMAEWKDIHVRIEGRAVKSLLRSFAKSYIIAGGSRTAVGHLLKYRLKSGQANDGVEFIYGEPGLKRSRIRKRFVEALDSAQEHVIIFSPYYFPDQKFLRAMWRARKRNVRVDVLIPFRSDVTIATYAAYAFFSIMTRRGVHVHMLQSMMHGKGVIVDDKLAIVGSSNIDLTSFYDNYEANVRLQDKDIVAQLSSTVRSWMQVATPLSVQEWRARGRMFRLKEWIATRLYQLWHRSNEHLDTLKKKGQEVKKSLGRK